MKRMLYRFLAGALAIMMLAVPAVAAEETEVQQPAPWFYSAVADCYAMGLIDDNYGKYINEPVSTEQLSEMTEIVANKLAVLELPRRTPDGTALVIDTTRGGVMNALYQVCADYALPGIEGGAETFLTGLGVVKGDGTGLAQSRVCTYQEAAAMAQRLVLAVYDSQDAGSKGLLWKAVNGDNTLYLLGTIHLDRSNVYPLHKSLREALLSAEKVAFELDFNDAEEQAVFAAKQVYSDGSKLSDHISPELYARVSRALTDMGMAEEEFCQYKPWALASTFTVLGSMDDTTGSNAMAIDLYANSLATWAGIPVEGVETYEFQGNIFDTLSAEYQEDYLDGALSLYEMTLEGSEPTSETVAAAELNKKIMDGMFAAWKDRDPDAFVKFYDKAAIVESDDELESRLFTDRDPGMIRAAAAYLEQEGSHTVFMAVGAGHMTDPGGIVSGLRNLGYTVELMK